MPHNNRNRLHPSRPNQVPSLQGMWLAGRAGYSLRMKRRNLLKTRATLKRAKS